MNGLKAAIISITLGLIVFAIPLSVFAITVEITATVIGCGDNIIQNAEQCDGSNLGGSSCTSRGFTGGTLSCTNACTFNTSTCESSSSGGGSSGGGSRWSSIPPTSIPYTPLIPTLPVIPNTNVIFSGRAYPFSRVNILKDGQLTLTTVADVDGNFMDTISGLSSGNYSFAAYAEDRNNIRSSLTTFSSPITSGFTTKIEDILIAPTIEVDKTQVKSGDLITIFGQSTPGSKINMSIDSKNEFSLRKISDSSGAYSINLDTSFLNKGLHHAATKAITGKAQSPFSNPIDFTVSTKNIFTELVKNLQLKGDLNDDGDVNLVDFSIGAYWYQRELSDSFKAIEADQLNGDGKIDLIDFSIIAFYWTG